MSGQMTAVELNKMRIDTGIDERTPEERKKARRKYAKSKSKRKRSLQQENAKKAAARDQKLAIFTIAVIGLVFLCVVFVSAYCTNLKYEINSMNKETLALQEDIDQLKVQIEDNTNIATIEKKARDDLDMIYPTAEQFVYINGEAAQSDMAQVIKENAYEF